ncbi:hypothetical protein RUMOBE_02963 [Blautia obeum ATCC 29174]|uniref:Uncharacterized protein n=1 Tax=Blautia obeum ATCC 29174 TaxID=411459 RepID=A5ZVC7_9FIRM|nr:hypothetical protein RUMOBE_02963 [Blautia obeum ATCC 29174]
MIFEVFRKGTSGYTDIPSVIFISRRNESTYH